MTLERVQVTGFRCLQPADLRLDPGLTVISGPNASGKTSLLEAIYLLGRGRSFRSARLEHLIQTGQEQCVVVGEFAQAGRRLVIGVEGSREGIRARVQGQRAESLAALAAEFPVQIIDPEVHRLIEEGPARRRRFMDWGVFHVEPQFIAPWQKFQRVLKQRNAALRAQQPASLVETWDADLIRYGTLVHEARLRYLQRLVPVAEALAERLLGLPLVIRYRSGWAQDLSFAEALRQSRAAEASSGTTTVGPHRADLALRLNEAPARDRISRGQQKLLAAGLLLAQLRLFPENAEVQPTLLLDDPAAELDDQRLQALIAEVAGGRMQLVVTSLHSELRLFGLPGRQYAVEQGRFTARD